MPLSDRAPIDIRNVIAEGRACMDKRRQHRE